MPATGSSLAQAEDVRNQLILARQAEDVAALEDVLSRYLDHAKLVRRWQNAALERAGL